ncbi:MAG: catalase [Anaeroplasmataceae bacterium]|nr:catalase [Anaeroplasmataceae bacterium]MDE5867539.1 catalase [Anaeroplasmataceae bacterium]
MLHPIKHFFTITHHRHLVIRYCFKVGIGFQGLRHDLSKYSFTEFWRGAKYYTGTASPNAKERKEKGYSLAWMHHKGRNKHHYEYWTDVVDGKYTPIRIPIRYLKESLCDRVAASKIYLKKKYTSAASLEYFDRVDADIAIHPESAKMLRTWLEWIAEMGEKKAFKKIKKIKTYE